MNNNTNNTSHVSNNPTAPGYPWYDDRVKVLREEAEKPSGWPYSLSEEEMDSGEYDTPKKIFEYLNRNVWKQEKAKKAASMIAWNSLGRGIKSNAMFVGPTGCGKTHIWRCLKQIFPNRIEIVDGSNLTQDGWKGSKKWNNLLGSPIFRSGEHTILVIDEADKMLSPKFTSTGENVSHSVQSEGLTLIEGTRVNVKEDSLTYEVDTSDISFVFCGAFSARAADMAEKQSGSRIGFGAAANEVKAYEKPIGESDLLKFGVMPEFMGRIQRVVNLERMTVDDYYRMTDSFCGPLERIGRQYGAQIRLTAGMRRELAEEALSSGLGIRGMENRIRSLLDEALFENCDLRCFEF